VGAHVPWMNEQEGRQPGKVEGKLEPKKVKESWLSKR
jgi:hypothetical protein